jgi:hypothetical protein
MQAGGLQLKRSMGRHIIYTKRRHEMGLLRRIFDAKRKKRSAREATGPSDAPGNRRIIKTARTFEAINEAAKTGLKPLVKRVKPSKEIHEMVAVFQNPQTGEITLSGDRRFNPKDNDLVKVMNYTLYYPHNFPEPFAAYLVPPDLTAGEEVWLEDLIEDIVAVRGNQGHQPRLPSAAAIWNGSEFEVLFNARVDAEIWLG